MKISRIIVETLVVQFLAFLLLGAVCTAGEEDALAKKLTSDTKARRVGDLLTVLIEEQAVANKDAKNSLSKKTSLSASASFAHPQIDSRPTAWTNAVLPKNSFDGERSFEGGSSMENKDKFTASMTVRVTDVAPNGNLIVQGRRSIELQDEKMDVTLTGTVRPADIARNNTVKSSSIADAVIRYTSKGEVSKSQKPGIIARVINWINPF